MKLKIGKSAIEITAEGCVRCGALSSHRWEIERAIPVTVGDRKPAEISLHVCGGCLGIPVPVCLLVGAKGKRGAA